MYNKNSRTIYLSLGPNQDIPLPRITALMKSLMQSRYTYVVDPLSERKFLTIFRMEDKMYPSDKELLTVMLSEEFDKGKVFETIKASFSARQFFPERGGYYWTKLPLPENFQTSLLANYVRREPRIGHTVLTEGDYIYSKLYLPPGYNMEDIMEGFWGILGNGIRTKFEPFVVYAKGKQQTLPHVSGH